MNVSGGILTGGKSSRMGSDKALLEWNQKTFLKTITEELSSFPQLLLSVDSKNKYSDLPYECVEDEHKGIGPLEGIRRLLQHSSHPYMFICACDMPFIKFGLAEYMSEFISSDYDCYVICDEKRIHPLCAIYSKDVLLVIDSMIADEDYKLIHLLRQVRTKYINIGQSCYSEKLIRNINTKEEYQSIVLPAVFCVSGIKNSGKTWLIIQLINGFIKDYKKIGVIKHDGHDFDIDHRNTDTWRFREAGAKVVSIFSPVKSASIRMQSDITVEEMIEPLGDMDLIIIEGMKNSTYPKIEVVREGVSNELVSDPNTIIAVATDTKVKHLSEQIPVFHLNDYEALVERIKEYFNMRKA